MASLATTVHNVNQDGGLTEHVKCLFRHIDREEAGPTIRRYLQQICDNVKLKSFEVRERMLDTGTTILSTLVRDEALEPTVIGPWLLPAAAQRKRLFELLRTNVTLGNENAHHRSARVPSHLLQKRA